MARGGYQWRDLPPIKDGKCTKHGCRVTKITRACLECHREQLADAEQPREVHRPRRLRKADPPKTAEGLF